MIHCRAERGRFFSREDRPLTEASDAALSRRLIGEYLQETPQFHTRNATRDRQPSLAAP